MTSREPTSRARLSAWFRMARTLASSCVNASPASCRGATLISRLNWPSSLAQLGSEIAASTWVLRIGRQRGLVDQVQLDLQAELRRLVLEAGLTQHPGQHVQAHAHLLAVRTPVLLGDRDGWDIPAHLTSKCWQWAGARYHIRTERARWPGQLFRGQSRHTEHMVR